MTRSAVPGCNQRKYTLTKAAPLTKGYQPQVYKDSNGDRMVVDSAGTLLLRTGAKIETTMGIGAAVGTAPTEVVDEQIGHVHRTTITLTNFVVNTTDVPSGEGYGSASLYTFPRGSIQLLGAVANLTITGGAGLTATAAVVAAVGTVAAAADATLTGTEGNIVPSYAATLASNAGVVKGRGVTGAFFDNTTTTNATQMPAILNFAVPDAGSTAATTITVSGTITISWINHGDN